MRRASINLFIFALILVAVPAMAIDQWLPMDQIKIAWDPVTTLGDGTAITPDLGTVEYEVVYAPESKENPKPIWNGDQTTATVSIPENGNWLIGIRTHLKVNGTVVSNSLYGWSDDPEIVSPEGGTFGILRYAPPKTITGLMKVTP